MKPKKGAKKAHPKKVFDVMRPGKTAAGATSRPVIVGHKPQIKDPMMSERDDAQRPLLDSKQKVAVAPTTSTSPSAAEPSQVPAQPSQPDTSSPAAPAVPTIEKAPETPPETVAALALADTVEAPAASPNLPADKPVQTPVATPQQTPAAQEPVEGTPRSTTLPETKESTGIIFEDVPTADDVLPASADKPADAPAESIEPLPVLPPEELPKAQVFVAHHSSNTGGMKVFLILLAVIILAVIALDVMLDAGFLSIDAIPHTNFL